jgi:hypothetical protein
MPPVIIGPRCNRRVTCDPSPSNDRSESDIAVNPLDPYNMVASSKRFTDPAIYAFSLAAYATFDGGQSWVESPPLALQPGWAGTSDPAVAWDDAGNAYLVALPFGPGTTPTDYVGSNLGIAVYKSSDGGRTWGAPNFIYQAWSDKQDAAGDINSSSPYYGNVYAAWDSHSGLAFARTTDHGATWKGVGAQPVGAPLASSAFAPDLSVAADGTVYIFWIEGNQIKFTKSTDGGNSFSAPASAATGIIQIPGKLPGGRFRTSTIPTACAGAGSNMVVAWADYREGVSRIYYRRSTNGGNTWQGSASGQPLMTGAVASVAGMHDFHPQLASTPNGEIGCAFYEFGEFPPNLINVILAVSTNNGNTFPNRATVTDRAWDPKVDEVHAHGVSDTTFIGDYFGLDASRLGFFPLWTDTRDGRQEIYSSRLAVNPADVYIRDSSSDTGSVPSPGYHWEYVDLIVRRHQDVNLTTGANFVNQDLIRDRVTDHYIYARVTNNGPNPAQNVRLSVMVGNWPSILDALPGTEFRYPQDWYENDWVRLSPGRHLYLGESAPINIPSGATKFIGPVTWPAAEIPPRTGWHPCLLAEARADNDDSADTTPGSTGCGIDADPNPCVFGSYFWGNNNITQRNLTYAWAVAGVAAPIELPFVVGSIWSTARFVEIVVDKGRELALTPMTLRLEPLPKPGEPPQPPCPPGELVLLDGGRVIVRVGNCSVGEIIAAPGTVWKPTCPSPSIAYEQETMHGGDKEGQEWKLNQPKAAVGVPIAAGEMRRATLSFSAPANLEPGTQTLLRIFQRNDRKFITGSVMLQLEVTEAAQKEAGVARPARATSRVARSATRRRVKRETDALVGSG